MRIASGFRWIPALALLACGGGGGDGDDRAADAPAATAPAPAGMAGAPPAVVRSDPAAARPYPAEFRTVRLRQSATVRFAPDARARKLGTVAAHSRLPFRGSAPAGNGCRKRWIEVDPAGWICEEMIEPSKLGPEGVEMPRLARAELVPGQFGKVTAAGARSYIWKAGVLGPGRDLSGFNVRRYRELVIDATPPPAPPPATPPGADAPPAAPPAAPPLKPGPRTYWDIGKDEVVPAEYVRVHEPSEFHGVRLGDETGLTLPVGFVWEAANPQRAVSSMRSARGGRAVRRLPGRSAWPVLEVARDAAGKPQAYRIAESEWVPARQMRVIEAAAPPQGTGPLERWIDVDLDRQSLVAYEGELPVYVTLVSTGARKSPTATGVYRIWIKFAEADMSGQMADEAPYSVATVPWTQYFSKDLALHTAYWHDGFGTPRSHGCVNLAPIDSRFLYFWSDPAVPPGWSMAHGHVDRPGSMVRVRSAADPAPAFQGYARDLQEPAEP